MKQTLGIFAILVLASVAGKLNAADVKSIVDSDKTWHYTYMYTTASEPYSHFIAAYVKMGYKGECELDGVTYHKFGTLSSLTPDMEEFAHPCQNREWLIREDAGRVYLRTDASPSSQNEQLLYDFNLKAGDHFTALMGQQYFGSTMTPYVVVSSDEVEIDGQNCRRIRYSPEDEESANVVFEAIEGFGTVSDWSLLPYPYHSDVAGADYQYSLCRVTDRTGKVYFENIPDSEVRTVREGRTWEYLYDLGNSTYRLVSKRFNGKQLASGHEYYRLQTVRDENLSLRKDADGSVVTTSYAAPDNSSKDAEVLMREEYGKVIRLVDDSEDADAESASTSEMTEKILYDFNPCRNNPVFPASMMTESGGWQDAKVTVENYTYYEESGAPRVIEGENPIKLNVVYGGSDGSGSFANELIAGVGPVKSGSIDMPGNGTETGCSILSRVYGEDSTVIYENPAVKDILATLGVGEIMTDGGNAKTEYYSLQGYRIGTPAPGSIVIVKSPDGVRKIKVK